jgi:hypothetical protein
MPSLASSPSRMPCCLASFMPLISLFSFKMSACLSFKMSACLSCSYSLAFIVPMLRMRLPIVFLQHSGPHHPRYKIVPV